MIVFSARDVAGLWLPKAALLCNGASLALLPVCG